MDLNTIRAVLAQHTRPHFFAPLGNKHHLEGFGVPAARAHVLDWWEASAVSLALPPSASSPSSSVSREGAGAGASVMSPATTVTAATAAAINKKRKK